MSDEPPAVRPKPSPVLDQKDPQSGRWGGLPERSGRRLSATLREATGNTFCFDLVVESIDGSPLEGPVAFHLHDSYPRWIQVIRKIRDGRFALFSEISARGIYTAGAQAMDRDGRWIGLELNLGSMPKLPRRFVPRERRRTGRPPPNRVILDTNPTGPTAAGVRWTGYLGQHDLDRIFEAALAAGHVAHGKLDWLMERLPAAYVASLHHGERPPRERLESQLRQMNDVHRLRSGKVPLALFLAALTEATADAATGAVFEREQAKVNGYAGPAPFATDDPAPTDPAAGSGSVSISLARGSTFRHAAQAIARAFRLGPPEFAGFTARELSAEISSMSLTIPAALDGLRVIWGLAEAGSVRRYVVRIDGLRPLLAIEEEAA